MKRLIVGTWRWLDDRLGISALIGPSLNHLVPHDARWWYVFGSATLVALTKRLSAGSFAGCITLARRPWC